MTDEFRPGDVFVVQGNGLFDRLIQHGQRVRFPELDAQWNHAGIVATASGGTIEAQGNGVQRGQLSPGRTYRVLAVEPQTARDAVLNFAGDRVGDRYGWLTIAAVVLRLLPPVRLTFGISGEYICSGLVASALDSAGCWQEDDPADAYPAEIAAHPLPFTPTLRVAK